MMRHRWVLQIKTKIRQIDCTQAIARVNTSLFFRPGIFAGHTCFCITLHQVFILLLNLQRVFFQFFWWLVRSDFQQQAYRKQ